MMFIVIPMDELNPLPVTEMDDFNKEVEKIVSDDLEFWNGPMGDPTKINSWLNKGFEYLNTLLIFK